VKSIEAEAIPWIQPVLFVSGPTYFIASPIFTVAFGWYVKAGSCILTVRAFPLPPIGAVAAVNVFA